MNDILERILAVKREEIDALQRNVDLADLVAQAQAAGPSRGFKAALAAKVRAGQVAVIAEIKKASPSKGLIRKDFDPSMIARDYADGGAACLSVLTDAQFFQGADAYLVAARAACALPVIRKDFLIDETQVVHARALGADCVLLIAAALDDPALGRLAARAWSLGMDVLVEVHDRPELDRVLDLNLLPRALLGINNRSLRSFETRLDVTLELLPFLPDDCEVVSESGIEGPADIARLRAAGVKRFLVGELLMRQTSPRAALRALICGEIA